MTKPRLRPKTENEKTIYNLIIRNRLPFKFIRGKMSLRGLAVDFVGKEKKKILEIHNEERTPEQLQDRLISFSVEVCSHSRRASAHYVSYVRFDIMSHLT